MLVDIKPWSGMAQLMMLISREFRKRGCREEVEAELTTQVFTFNNVECEMVVTIKVYPVATGNAAQRTGSPQPVRNHASPATARKT